MKERRGGFDVKSGGLVGGDGVGEPGKVPVGGRGGEREMGRGRKRKRAITFDR